MTFRDDMRALANGVRAIPGQMGMRPYSVAVVTKSYAGTYPGEGALTETVTAITNGDGQPPKVRFLNDEQIALGGLPKGSVEVGPITPDFPGGGTLITTLNGDGADPGELFRYRLTGPEFPNGSDFLLVGLQSDRAFQYRVTLKPLTST